jgi:hypothetical protein
MGRVTLLRSSTHGPLGREIAEMRSEVSGCSPVPAGILGAPKNPRNEESLKLGDCPTERERSSK